MARYLDISPPFPHGSFGHRIFLLHSSLVFLEHDLQANQEHATDDTKDHHDEHPPHVTEAQGGRRIVIIVIAFDLFIEQDPFVV